MPLVLLVYWLNDVEVDLGAHGKADTDWLRGVCVPYAIELMHHTIYHHGKWSNARNTDYQKGTVFQIEPGWRSRVFLVADGEYAYGDEPSESGSDLLRWDTLVYGSVRSEERDTCEGSVGMSLAQTIAACKPLAHWVPQLTMNVSQPCYLRNTDGDPDPEQVFFDIEEPLSFYYDLAAIGVLGSVSLFFASLLLSYRCVMTEAAAPEDAGRYDVFAHLGGSAAATPTGGSPRSSNTQPPTFAVGLADLRKNFKLAELV